MPGLASESRGSGKTHMDYAYDLDLVVKPDSSVPGFGREFGAFTGAGVPLFALGGGVYRYLLSEILVKFHVRRGYFVAETPIIASSNLFDVSGHLSYYRKNMFLFDIEGHEYAIKPMNCPYHILVFMHELARYRGKVPLPFKIFEVGRVHRYEPSGSLYGLLRVRGFTQDDAHIITPGDAAVRTVFDVIEEMKLVYEKLYGLRVDRGTVTLRLSFSDKSKIGTEFMGTREEWEAAEGVLEEAARRVRSTLGLEYTVEEGEAAFYGPKIDVVMKVEEAGIVKEWQAGTVQFDFNLPRRFRLYELAGEIYGTRDIFIIHRALLGSIERFLGIFLEHARGRLPFTLAPLQVLIVAILTGDQRVDQRIRDAARSLEGDLYSKGIRVAVIETSKTGLSGAVRNVEATVKPPVMAFIGAKEAEQDTVTVRYYTTSRERRDLRNVKGRTDTIIGIIEELEAPIAELAGASPRLPVRLGHIV